MKTVTKIISYKVVLLSLNLSNTIKCEIPIYIYFGVILLISISSRFRNLALAPETEMSDRAIEQIIIEVDILAILRANTA